VKPGKSVVIVGTGPVVSSSLNQQHPKTQPRIETDTLRT
jgi:hypothetical protein